MCLGKDSGAGAAATQQAQLMEQQQAKHDAAVTQGKQSIDDAFSQFNDPYYDSYGQTYKDTYNPQLDQQYALAKDKLIAKLAGTDQLGSGVGNNAIALQDQTYNNSKADIANHATDAENSLRSAVDNTKSNLYTENNATADPLTMASQAQSQSGAIVAPQSYPTLGNVFADGLNSVATATKANSQSMTPYFTPTQNSAPSGGGGSAVWGI
jgi:hypothetical protein